MDKQFKIALIIYGITAIWLLLTVYYRTFVIKKDIEILRKNIFCIPSNCSQFVCNGWCIKHIILYFLLGFFAPKYTSWYILFGFFFELFEHFSQCIFKYFKKDINVLLNINDVYINSNIIFDTTINTVGVLIGYFLSPFTK